MKTPTDLTNQSKTYHNICISLKSSSDDNDDDNNNDMDITITSIDFD